MPKDWETIDTYNPHEIPSPEEWLELDEDECMALVENYHKLRETDLPNVTLHAVIHTVVENQLAMGLEEVQGAMDRLIGDGLDRHDALHAIGSVLSEHLWEQSQGKTTGDEREQKYNQDLGKLTAEKWQSGR
jgi:hypothetical protein